jgi:hypothetical protein
MITGPKGLRPEKDYAGVGQQYMLSSESAPHKNKTVTVKE